MAQLDFFLCREERIELANLILGMGLEMIPDLEYELSNYVSLDSIDKYVEYVDKNELIFIINRKTFKYPFVFGTFEKRGVKKYFIRQRYGGPTIDFYYPGLMEKENKIGPGFISNYPFYYDEHGDKFYPSDEDKEVFKILSRFISKNSRSVKLTKRTFWIGNKSIDLCKNSGFHLVDIGGKNLLDYL
jgi:hypothetical protein